MNNVEYDSILCRLRSSLTGGINRFDGRAIRVDKASDTGPRGGSGRGGSYPSRGGGYGQQPQMPYAAGQPVAYGMPNPMMYQPTYGRGGYPPQQAYGTPPPQGKDNLSSLFQYKRAPTKQTSTGYAPYGYADPQQQQGQQGQHPQQQQPQGGQPPY